MIIAVNVFALTLIITRAKSYRLGLPEWTICLMKIALRTKMKIATLPNSNQ
jgi:hypothetical protein